MRSSDFFCQLAGTCGAAAFILGSHGKLFAAPGRMIVGLKVAATPSTLLQLARETESAILSGGAGATYVLLLPRRERTAAQLKAASALIRYVEPEQAMGIAAAQSPIPAGSRLPRARRSGG